MAEEKSMTPAESRKPKRKGGSGTASVTEHCTAKREEISQIIQESYQFFNLPKVQTDEECAERLNHYFQLCAERGQIPTVEDMALALGTIRQTLWEWEQGSKGVARRDMVKKAKEILAGIDAKLVSQGKIPQVTYIFRAKNFFGMRDQQEVVLTPNNPLGDPQNAEQLRQKYLDAAGLTESDDKSGDPS